MGEKGNGRKEGGGAKQVPGTGKRSIGTERGWEGGKEERRRGVGRGGRKGPVVWKGQKRK